MIAREKNTSDTPQIASSSLSPKKFPGQVQTVNVSPEGALKLSEFKNSYALITGASSGLGLAFAEEFARRGLNLVLVARNQERLFRVAKSLEVKFDITTLAIPMDLNEPSAPEELKAHLREKNIKIRLLCNNAGVGDLKDFASQSLKEIQETIQLNNVALVSLCHVFLEDLAFHPRSAVINVSSAASFLPVPYMAVYAASKAFVQSFSQALYYEWKDRGVFVQTLTPGVIDTEFNTRIGFDVKKMKNVMTPQEVVQISLKDLERQKVISVATKGILLQKFFAGFFPPRFVLKTVAKMFRPSK